MSVINRIGDFYHRNAYRYIAGATAKVTDSTRLAFSDVVLGVQPYFPEALATTSGLLMYELYASGNPQEIAYKTLVAVAIPIGLLFASYGLNWLRTPVKKKLGLDTKDLDESKEFSYAIHRLNELTEADRLSFNEVNNQVNISIDNLCQELFGYPVYHAKKAKNISFFLDN